MPSLAQLYAAAIRRHLGGYHAAWLPDTALRLGDVGVFQDGVFVRQGDLSHFYVEFAAQPDSSPSRLDYTASDSVEVSFKASGETNTALPSTLGVVHQSGGVLKLDPGTDVTPFLRPHRMTPHLFGERDLKPLSLLAAMPRPAQAPANNLAARRRQADAHFLAPVLNATDGV